MRGKAVLRSNQYMILAEKNKVNLHAWISTDQNSYHNVGDYLSFVVVQAMCKKNGVGFYATVGNTKHLYAIGSILLGYENATIWGSGFGYDNSNKWYFRCDALLHKLLHKTDIRIVRGPETRRILTKMGIHCPELYGDPAVLMPLIYTPNSQETVEYIVSPHYSKSGKYEGQKNILGTCRRNYQEYIDKLCSAKLVISSSLHGIILAETYGIPAIMLADTPCEDITKYKDWYHSTGRMSFPIANSIAEALEMTPSIPAQGVLESMRQRLIETFPCDLWDKL